MAGWAPPLRLRFAAIVAVGSVAAVGTTSMALISVAQSSSADRWVVAEGGTPALSPPTSPRSAPPAPSRAPSPSASPEATPPTPGPSVTRSARPKAPATKPAPRRGTALALLGTLAVKGRAPKTGYDRDRFGQTWLDTNRNGCDTRNDILGRDMTQPQFKAGTRGCVVMVGVLADPFTGEQIRYVRGSNTVDVDHVVSLSNSWQTGSFRWQIRKRAAFANDPMNLLAVDMSENRSKGDGDTATWLPPNKSYRCAYVARQVSVKAKYGLWVTSPERDAMRRILRGCPGRPALTGGAPVLAPFEVKEPSPRSSPQPFSGGGSVHYENCDAVRAAGADPIRTGDPGYAGHLDRDGDGVGCE